MFISPEEIMYSGHGPHPTHRKINDRTPMHPDPRAA